MLVVPSTLEWVSAGLPIAGRVTEVELEFAGLVREIGHRLSVRRPGRRVLVDAGGVGQIARVALGGRHGDDVTAHLERRTRPGGGEGGAAQEIGAFRVALAGSGKVGVQADGQCGVAAGSGVPRSRFVQVQSARLFVHDPSAPGRGVENREIGMLG